MSEQIKVTPGKLQTTASQFENEGEQIAATTGAMINIATALSGAWQGAASSAYIAKLRGMEVNIQRLVKMIREHSSDLKQMAQNYERAEVQNAEAASAIRQSEVH